MSYEVHITQTSGAPLGRGLDRVTPSPSEQCRLGDVAGMILGQDMQLCSARLKVRNKRSHCLSVRVAREISAVSRNNTHTLRET